MEPPPVDNQSQSLQFQSLSSSRSAYSGHNPPPSPVFPANYYQSRRPEYLDPYTQVTASDSRPRSVPNPQFNTQPSRRKPQVTFAKSVPSSVEYQAQFLPSSPEIGHYPEVSPIPQYSDYPSAPQNIYHPSTHQNTSILLNQYTQPQIPLTTFQATSSTPLYQPEGPTFTHAHLPPSAIHNSPVPVQQYSSASGPAKYNPNVPYENPKFTSALKFHIATENSLKTQVDSIDITNTKTKLRNLREHRNANLSLSSPSPESKYNFNPCAFQTPFGKTKSMNYLQIVRHQRNSNSPVKEYLFLRPFSNGSVSRTGLKVDIDYDSAEGGYVSSYTSNIDPTTADGYVEFTNVGVVTDERTFCHLVGFVPVPMEGGANRRPGRGDNALPLASFRGWIALLIMESKQRGILY